MPFPSTYSVHLCYAVWLLDKRSCTQAFSQQCIKASQNAFGQIALDGKSLPPCHPVLVRVWYTSGVVARYNIIKHDQDASTSQETSKSNKSTNPNWQLPSAIMCHLSHFVERRLGICHFVESTTNCYQDTFLCFRFLCLRRNLACIGLMLYKKHPRYSKIETVRPLKLKFVLA